MTCDLCLDQKQVLIVPAKSGPELEYRDRLAACPRCCRPASVRERLPIERHSIGRKFKIGAFKMYAHIGLYPDGRPAELFVRADHQSGDASGLLQAAAMAVSVALQYGAPLRPLMMKWQGTRFEPSGLTGDLEFPMVKSPLDYIARWALTKFPQEDDHA